MKTISGNSGRLKAGFSRQELCVVLLTLGVLATIQFRSLGDFGGGDSAMTCRNNLRQLIQGWLMYADDHDGDIAPAGGGGWNSGMAPNNRSWMGGWIDFVPNNPLNTNVHLLINPEYNGYSGHVGPYLNRNVRIFKCPEDRSTIQISGKLHGRSRSVSINSWMGGTTYCGQDQFIVYRRLEEMAEPGKRWVVMVERPDSINDAWQGVDMIDNMIDFPSFYHANGGHLAMADGSVVYRRWMDRRTIPHYVPGENMPLNVPMANNPDLDWVRERTTELKE